jgi:hypothetical protein
MDDPKPCPETWALHAQAQIAAQAMHLARICRNDSPAGCADASPEVFAALIQAQPLNRIADALGALERIANALEAGTRAEGAQPATSPAAAPEEPAPLANPVASWGGWRRDQTSFVNSSRGFVEVPEGGRLAILPIGRKFRAKDFWAVDPGDRWAPIVAFVDWSFVEEPATTPTTAPQGPLTGDPDTLVPGTSQEGPTGGSGAPQGEGTPEGAQAGQEGPIATPGGEPEKPSMGELLEQAKELLELELPGLERVSSGAPVAASGGELVKLSMNELLRLGLSRLPQTSSGEEATPDGEPERPSFRHGCICDRLPTRDDADGDDCVLVWKNGRWVWIWYHHVFPGEPWRPCS